MDQDGVEVPKHAKKNDANILQSWPDKLGQQCFYYVKKNTVFFWSIAGNPKWEDKAILPARVANHSAG